MNRVYMYPLSERVWHWLQAAMILTLLATGLSIHVPELPGAIGFEIAVRLHNVLGIALLVNAFLGLFYHVTTGEIRQYLPEPRDYMLLAFRQARYYLSGIFKGEPHPIERHPHAKLNPLQKVTYLAILNVLLPLQVVTGIAILYAEVWPGVIEALGGLGTLAKIHTAGAWLFAAFIVIHIYLTTTGPTPSAYIKAMITGWDAGEGDTDGGAGRSASHSEERRTS